MITTVTLNPAIDRAYFISEHTAKNSEYIYDNQDIKVRPGGKGLLTAINLKKLGYSDVQNIGFIGGKQGFFFKKMVQEQKITTNYIYTEKEIRNNVFIIAKDPVSYTHYNDYTYRVDKKDVEDLIKRYKRAIVGSECVIIAGSIPTGVDFDIYKRMASVAKDQGKEVMLQASGKALSLALSEKPKMVLPYFKHTREIFDVEVKEFEDYVEMSRKLLEKGAQSVIIPYHCDRLLFIEDRAFQLSPVNFCLRNWLGAGDAYNAALFDYIKRKGFDFVKANKYAGAAALTVAEKRSIFIEDRDSIKENMDRIKIKELEV